MTADSQSANVVQPPRYVLLRRGIAAFGIYALIMLVAFSVWSHAANAALRATLATLARHGVPTDRSAFEIPPVAEVDNSAPLWFKAGKALAPAWHTTQIQKFAGRSTWSKSEHDLMMRTVDQNSRAMELARLAATRPTTQWPGRTGPLASSSLAFSLVDAMALGHLGELFGDATAMARMDHHPRELVAGLYLQWVIADAIDSGPPSLSAHYQAVLMRLAATRSAVRSLPEISSNKVPRAELRQLLQRLLDESSINRGTRQALAAAGVVARSDLGSPPDGLTFLGPLFTFELVRILGAGDRAIAAIGRPTLAAALQTAGGPVPQSPSPLHRAIFTQSRRAERAYSATIRSYFQALSLQRSVATTVAALLYRSDTGRDAKTLVELVPTYLPRPLLDPLTGQSVELHLTLGKINQTY